MADYKKGLDYFRHDTDMSSADQGMELIEAEFGLKGYAIYIKLLEKIYGENGYYMEWNKDIKLLFARRVGETGSLIDEVINGLLRRGLFSKSVFEMSGALTSKAIQSRYLDATKRREKVDIGKEYLVLSPNEYKKYGNVNIKTSNVDISTQRREEKSTEEESRAYKPRTDDVEMIYQAYPRKVGKGNALNKIRKSLKELAKEKDNPVDWLLEKVVTFAESPKGNEGKFTPYPATWFNQERYFDDEQEWQKQQKNEQTRGDRQVNQLKSIISN